MSGQAISFLVPGKPIGKGRAKASRFGAGVRLYSPQKTVAYESLVAFAAHGAMAGRSMLDGAVTVTLDIRCQVPASWSAKKRRAALAGEIHPTTKPDIDNVEKSIFDGLNGVAWKDDVQVVDVCKRKRYVESPGVLVTIASFAPALQEALELEAALP